MAALTAWVAVLAVAIAWGHHLFPTGRLNVHAPPFQGHYRFLPTAVLPGLVVAAAAVVVLPPAALRHRWSVLLWVSAAGTAVWAFALAVIDGHESVGGPLGRAHEYLPAVPRVGDEPGAFLSGYADLVADRELPVHVNGHPPLMVLVFWAWDRLGLSGPGWAGVLVIAAGASAVAALLITVRALGDESSARRAAPFLVLGPFAVTIATSADAFFLGVAAWAAAALAVGLRRGSWWLLAISGLLAGALPYLSYGLLPYAAVLLAVGWLGVREYGCPGGSGGRRLLAVGAGVAGLLVVPVLMTAAGFSWFDGAQATHRAWSLGKGDDRPYLYSMVADVAILAVLVGPATAVAATRRAPRVPLVLAGSAALGLAVLAVSGITRLEVERIWLPWAPWLVLLTAAFVPGGADDPRMARCAGRVRSGVPDGRPRRVVNRGPGAVAGRTSRARDLRSPENGGRHGQRHRVRRQRDPARPESARRALRADLRRCGDAAAVVRLDAAGVVRRGPYRRIRRLQLLRSTRRSSCSPSDRCRGDRRRRDRDGQADERTASRTRRWPVRYGSSGTPT